MQSKIKTNKNKLINIQDKKLVDSNEYTNLLELQCKYDAIIKYYHRNAISCRKLIKFLKLLCILEFLVILLLII